MACASLALLLQAGAVLAQPAPGTPPSAADLESARELYKEAKDLRAKGDLRGALERFKAAHAYGQTPVTGLELGRAHMDLGELLEAREAFLGVGRLKVASDETEKSVQARAEAADLAEKLRPRIPTLTVKLTGVPGEAPSQISVDGAPLPVVGQTAIRKVNPGTHAIVAKVGAREEKRDAALTEGEAKEVAIDFTGTPVSSGTASGTGTGEDRGASGGAREISPVTWIGAGIAVAGLGTGAVAGILALGKKSDVSSACVGTKCPPNLKSTVDSGRKLATVSTIGFVAGAAGAGLAAIGYFVLSKPSAPEPSKTSASITPVFGPTSVGLEGTF